MDSWRTVTRSDIDQWQEAARNGDPEAALRVGEFMLQRARDGRHKAGDDQTAALWLERAAMLGGLQMMWRIADMAKEFSFDIAVRWQRAAIAAEWRDSSIGVDENAFPLIDYGGWVLQDFAVRVSGIPDDAVREALTAAGPRMFSVGDDGIEYEDGDVALDSADYNPNFVSDPEPHAGGGWKVWMDCKSEAYPLMAATMLRILADELHKAGVRSAQIRSVDRLPQEP